MTRKHSQSVTAPVNSGCARAIRISVQFRHRKFSVKSLLARSGEGFTTCLRLFQMGGGKATAFSTVSDCRRFGMRPDLRQAAAGLQMSAGNVRCWGKCFRQCYGRWHGFQSKTGLKSVWRKRKKSEQFGLKKDWRTLRFLCGFVFS